MSFGWSPALCGLVILVSVSLFSTSLIYDYYILLYLILDIPYVLWQHRRLVAMRCQALDSNWSKRLLQHGPNRSTGKYVPKGIATNQQLMLPPAGRLKSPSGRTGNVWAQLSTTVQRRMVRVKWRQANRLRLSSQGGKTTSKAMPGCLGCGLGPLRMSKGGAQMGEPEGGFL